MKPKTARIARIHALEESIAPARRAFEDLWPEAECFDLTDTSLSSDRATMGLEGPVAHRIQALADYAQKVRGTAGILFTCSAFGTAIEAAGSAAPIPVLSPTEGAFEAAVKAASHIGLLVTFEPSLLSVQHELAATARKTGRSVKITALLASGALQALRDGNVGEHDRIISDAAATLHDVDVVILGQFSMARAAPRVRATIRAIVIATPDAAVTKLKRLVARP